MNVAIRVQKSIAVFMMTNIIRFSNDLQSNISAWKHHNRIFVFIFALEIDIDSVILGQFFGSNVLLSWFAESIPTGRKLLFSQNRHIERVGIPSGGTGCGKKAQSSLFFTSSFSLKVSCGSGRLGPWKSLPSVTLVLWPRRCVWLRRCCLKMKNLPKG